MFRPRWDKVLTDLWGNKVRSLLVIASITIGLFAVGLIANMNVVLMQDMRIGYAAFNPANIQVSTSPFGHDLVERARRVEGVRQAEGVHTLSLRVENDSGAWSPIDIKAIDEIDQMEVSQVKRVEGAWPPDDHEIVVDQYKAGDLNTEIGDFITVELPSGKTRQMRLVGIVHDQTIGAAGLGNFFLAPVQGYITLETLNWLEQPEVMTHLLVTVEGDDGDEEYLRQVANRVSQAVEDDGVMVYSSAVRASDDHPNRIYVQAITSVLYMLGLLVMFLSAFLITNTLSALLNQQVQQIGVMKTIGARRGQIMSIYMVLIFILGVIAFLIAMPLSSQAAYLLLKLLAGQVNMELQGFRFVPLAVILQIMIALIVPQVAAFLPILHGTRISAVEAFSGYSQAHPPSKKKILDRALKRVRRVPRPHLISLRNTFRNRTRLALTLITLTLGGAIFIATFNVQGSLSRYIQRIGKYYSADINLSLGKEYRIQEVQQALEDVQGVSSVEGWAAARSEVVMPDGTVGESVMLLGPPAGSPLVDPVLLEGRWVIPGDQNAIALSERFMELFPEMEVGDSLRLKVNGEEVDLVVVGFFQLAGKSSGYMAYTSYEYLSELTHRPQRTSIYRVTGDRPGMTLQEQELLGSRIEAKLEQRGITVVDVEAGHALSEETADGLNVLTGFLLIMASMIAVVGSIGLTGTMSMNVMERTREIGVMRAIGASDRAVMSLVLLEGLLIGILSWGLGTLLAFPISTLMSNAINISLFGAAASFTFTPTGVLVWLGVVLALSVLASVMPARNAARLTIREVLAYE